MEDLLSGFRGLSCSQGQRWERAESPSLLFFITFYKSSLLQRLKQAEEQADWKVARVETRGLGEPVFHFVTSCKSVLKRSGIQLWSDSCQILRFSLGKTDSMYKLKCTGYRWTFNNYIQNNEHEFK